MDGKWVEKKTGLHIVRFQFTIIPAVQIYHILNILAIGYFAIIPLQYRFNIA